MHVRARLFYALMTDAVRSSMRREIQCEHALVGQPADLRGPIQVMTTRAVDKHNGRPQAIFRSIGKVVQARSYRHDGFQSLQCVRRFQVRREWCGILASAGETKHSEWEAPSKTATSVGDAVDGVDTCTVSRSDHKEYPIWRRYGANWSASMRCWSDEKASRKRPTRPLKKCVP